MPGDEYMRWCAVVVNAHLCERLMLTYTVYIPSSSLTLSSEANLHVHFIVCCVHHVHAHMASHSYIA